MSAPVRPFMTSTCMFLATVFFSHAWTAKPMINGGIRKTK